MAQHPPSLPLDETLYKAEEFAFVKEETGICDADALKKHILAVQTKAYALRGFPCVRLFEFAKTKLSVLPAYEEVLKLGREREGAILLDLGCCCGTDIRKVARDGFPMGNLLASDVVADYWNIGHELFLSTPETFPVVFLLGDALDPGFLEPRTPLATPSAEVTDSPPPPLTSLTCLTSLHGRVSVIHISSVFHLFSEEQQLDLARSLAGLLAPLPGSIILGSHNGALSKGVGRRFLSQGVGQQFMFLHSPESWRELWEGVFPRGTIKVKAELEESTWADGKDRAWLTWSVGETVFFKNLKRLKATLLTNSFMFLPFNAGPRICLGQQFAYSEMSFVLIRLLQSFSSFALDADAFPPEARPPLEWAALEGRKAYDQFRPKMHLTMYSEGGMWLKMTEAGDV